MDVPDNPRPTLRWAIFCSIYEPVEVLILAVVDNEIDAVNTVSQHYQECDVGYIEASRTHGYPVNSGCIHLNHVFMVPCPEDYEFEMMVSGSFKYWEATGFNFERNLYVAPPVDEIPKSWAVA